MENINTDMRIKVLFNPQAGSNKEDPSQLEKIVREFQLYHYSPEVFIIEKGKDVSGIIRDALSDRISRFAVCGGDSTVSAVAGKLLYKDAALGIIPVGTQNNIAFSLGIPGKIPAAVSALDSGRRIRIDAGAAACRNVTTPFLEVCSVGILSSVFPACDRIQHGNLMEIGSFFTNAVGTPKAEFHLVLDNQREITQAGHMVLIANMPYVIRHFQVGKSDAFCDGLFDIYLFSNISKIGLMGYAIAGPNRIGPEDSRIRHYRARCVDIDSNPAMSIMADGRMLGKGRLHVEIKKHALSVLVPNLIAADLSKAGENHAEQ